MGREKIKIGLVGLGRMGGYHLAKLRQMDRVELVGVYDPRLSVSLEQAPEGVVSFANYASLLFEADAVIVASPTFHHFAHVKEALDGGLHVLVEKPLTEKSEDARKLADLAGKNDLILQVGFVERYKWQALRYLPLVGQVRHAFFTRHVEKVGREPSLSVVSDLMIHDLDLALAEFEDFPVSIEARARKTVSSAWDEAQVKLRFEGERQVELSASRIAERACRKMVVENQSYQVHLNWVNQTQEVFKKKGDNQWEFERDRQVEIDALNEQLTHFIDSIELQTPTLVDAQSGVRVTELTELILLGLEISEGRPTGTRSVPELKHALELIK